MKIIVLDGYGVNPGDLTWDCLQPFGTISIFDKTATTEDTITRLQGATVAITNKTPITAEILDACPSVRLVCVTGTGFNVVDHIAAKDRGIPVCNVPDYGTNAVAQFTFALLLEVCHQIGHHDKLVHQGRWTSCPTFCFWDTPQMELAGKTIGIIGFGRIGRAVGTIAKAFGMHVLAYNRSRHPEGEKIATYADLHTLLQKSDIISLHCPLTPETESLINQDTIAVMKDGVILINTSRGPVLNEADVAQALQAGKLKACAVDVAAIEPIPANSPLLTAPNCFITPHMAWTPAECRQRILDCTADNIRGWLEGHPVNAVNGF